MTMCVLEKTPTEKEKLKDRKMSSISVASNISVMSNEIKTEMDEFVQITLNELLGALVPLEKGLDFDDVNKCDNYEEHWIKFTQKAEKPFN